MQTKGILCHLRQVLPHSRGLPRQCKHGFQNTESMVAVAICAWRQTAYSLNTFPMMPVRISSQCMDINARHVASESRLALPTGPEHTSDWERARYLDSRHAGIVPAVHVLGLHKPSELALAEHGVHQRQPRVVPDLNVWQPWPNLPSHVNLK